MARECFEDPDVATVMNDKFVNIKVDREERPDLDKVYQLGHTLLSRGNGGWPLTVFLNPQSHIPFFAGTYFPRSPKFGLPGFVDVLHHVSRAFSESQEKFEEFESKMHQALAGLQSPKTTEVERSNVQLYKTVRDVLISNYDPQSGGFGNAPKFPQPMGLEWLLQAWFASKKQRVVDTQALDAVIHTLTQMARGGIYDQIGGGFFRYSTDRYWNVPHFEKMLYDNGLLLGLYADAYSISGDELFQEVIGDTCKWLTSEMCDSGGGFFGAIDADSEGIEGKFYVWRRNEVQRVLNETEYLIVETLYGLDKPKNFENHWHLRRTDAWKTVIHRLSLDPNEAIKWRESARAKLKQVRDQRIRPSTDTKILTSWNGLAIEGIAKSAQVLRRRDLLKVAQDAVDFIHANSFDGKRLRAVWSDGSTNLAGYSDDYAYLINGLLTLLTIDWREQDVLMALTLADSLIEWFFDEEEGGFWFTSHDHEPLIKRLKPLQDDSTPSGNGAACLALLRIANLTGEPRFMQPVEKTLEWARPALVENGALHSSLVRCLHKLTDHNHVVLLGPKEKMADWRDSVSGTYRPNVEVWSIPLDRFGYLPDYLKHFAGSCPKDSVTALTCKNFVCSEPITELTEFTRVLNEF